MILKRISSLSPETFVFVEDTFPYVLLLATNGSKNSDTEFQNKYNFGAIKPIGGRPGDKGSPLTIERVGVHLGA